VLHWDQMFGDMARYGEQLRGGSGSLAYPGVDPAVAAAGMAMGSMPEEIMPEEAAVLEALLGLIRRLAVESEVVRAAFVGKWPVVYVLFCLLSGRVTVALKAALLETLAAFAVVPAIAAEIWRALETSQLLQTVPRAQQAGLAASVTTYAAAAPTTPLPGMATGDIRDDLEQIESTNETYPETAAFVRLLTTLITTLDVPTTLGEGYREPGIAAYVAFVVDHVFLRLRERKYRDEGEMWALAAQTLAFFHHLASAVPVEPPAPAAAAGWATHPGLRFLQTLLTSARDEAGTRLQRQVRLLRVWQGSTYGGSADDGSR